MNGNRIRALNTGSTRAHAHAVDCETRIIYNTAAAAAAARETDERARSPPKCIKNNIRPLWGFAGKAKSIVCVENECKKKINKGGRRKKTHTTPRAYGGKGSASVNFRRIQCVSAAAANYAHARNNTADRTRRHLTIGRAIINFTDNDKH